MNDTGGEENMLFKKEVTKQQFGAFLFIAYITTISNFEGYSRLVVTAVFFGLVLTLRTIIKRRKLNIVDLHSLN